MKILHINTLTDGGAAIAAIRLHENLVNEGMESYFLSLYPSRHPISNHQVFLNSLSNVEQKVLPLRLRVKAKIKRIKEKTFMRGEKIPQRISSLFDITQHPWYQQSDIIHLHWINDFIDYPSFFEKNKKPIVWTLHDTSPFSGGYAYLSEINSNRFQQQIKQIEQAKSKYFSDQDMHIIPLSTWIKNASIQSNLFKHLPHQIIPNSVNLNSFYQEKKDRALAYFKREQGPIRLLFVSHYLDLPRKGLKYILECFSTLQNEYPNIRLCLAGKNPPLIKSNMEYLGKLNTATDLRMAYSLADVLLIPSLEDNLPNTIMEAMACGLPVIGFPTGGIPDMIQEGQTGFLTKEVSADSLYQTTKRFLDKPNPFSAIEIREMATKRYHPKKQAMNFSRLYQHIYSKNK